MILDRINLENSPANFQFFFSKIYLLNTENLHHEKDPATCNPLSSDAFSFYLVATNDIDQKLGAQKSVGISTNENILGCRPVSYNELRNKIIEAGNGKIKE